MSPSLDPRLTCLASIAPFRFLPPEVRARLAQGMGMAEFAPGQTILRQADTLDRRVFLLVSGLIETVDQRATPPKLLGLIEAGRFFGERAALFEEPRRFEQRARSACSCAWIEPEPFLELLRDEPVFAQQFGLILRERRGIFAAFDRFQAEVLHGIAKGEISLRSLLPLYRALEPALHPKLARETEVDWAALSYAVRRLPENVTRNFLYFLTDDLPEFYAALASSFASVSTEARPRSVYSMMPGKSMVLLRDGMSDLVDLVTCLCLYAIEARKLRRRLRQPGAIAALSRLPADLGSLPTVCATPGAPDSCADLESLPFDAPELERLRSIWPLGTLERLREIALHHEDYALEIKKQVHNYNSAHAERWTEQIASATRKLLGCDPADLPLGRAVHVISSNTHSVVNCLSPYWAARADAVRAFGRETRPEWEAAFAEPADLVYALGPDWLRARAPERESRLREQQLAGMSHLSESAFTGIQVDLIDLARLRGKPIDARLPRVRADADALIVNIDFAFGRQAEEIIGNLITLFGRNIASVNVLGKAGAVAGRRGDLLVPDSFLEQSDDRLLQLPRQVVDLARLRARAPEREVHVGRLLTVGGTLLQNRMMLHYYRRIWGCLGLEMEGWYYWRKLSESQQLGLLRPDLDLRFLYYVSDLPLDPEANLSGRLAAAEGIPPLYAITREILSGILES